MIAAEPIVGHHWVPGPVEEIAKNIHATWIVDLHGGSIVTDEATARRLGCPVGARWYRFAGPRVLRDRTTTDAVCFSEQYVPNTVRAREAIAAAAFSVVAAAHQRVEQEIRADLLDDEQAGALGAESGSAALVVVRRHYGAQGRLVAIGIHIHPSDRYSITMQLPLLTTRNTQ